MITSNINIIFLSILELVTLHSFTPIEERVNEFVLYTMIINKISDRLNNISMDHRSDLG